MEETVGSIRYRVAIDSVTDRSSLSVRFTQHGSMYSPAIVRLLRSPSYAYVIGAFEAS